MRIFGSKRITKTSGYRATNVATHSAMPVTEEETPIRALEVTDEMPIVREIGLERGRGREAEDVEVESRRPDASTTGEDGDSDVFVCRRSSPDYSEEAAAAAKAAAEGVTLYVYGWESVEPGSLSWAFPSLRAALDAVKTMRNAVEWCIVAGSEWASIEAARAKGAVLIEQNS